MIDLRQQGLASHWLVGIFACVFGFIGISWFDDSESNMSSYEDPSLCYHVPRKVDDVNRPKGKHSLVLDDSFVAFKEAVGFKESGGNYQAVNRFGYLGKYQFHMNTLKLLGVKDQKRFLSDSELQEEAFYWYTARNKWILRKDLKRSVGQTIHGILITESGILAAAHLAGAGNVKKFLRSQGQYQFQDAFGTSIQNYLSAFADYDTRAVPALDQWVSL
jgi:hypothetical protein